MLVPHRQQAVAGDVLRDIVVNVVLREVFPLDEQLGVKTVFQHPVFSSLMKESRHVCGGFPNATGKSALAELGSPTGGLEAVFLTLLHTRIAGEEAGGLHG